jgi:Mn-containing catalase
MDRRDTAGDRDREKNNMAQLRELLIEEMQDLLQAETQLIAALPKMATAAHHPKLKEAFDRHLQQTGLHAERLKQAFKLLGEKAQAKPCKAMTGLIEAGEEKMQEARRDYSLTADLALIGAAQKIEHYEISGYGTARALARQIGENGVAQLLSQTLGEEESADYLLTVISQPIIQQATLDDMGGQVNLEYTPAPAGETTKRRATR